MSDCRNCLFFNRIEERRTHYLGPHCCAAFEEIPMEIWTGKVSHDKPIGNEKFRFVDIRTKRKKRPF